LGRTHELMVREPYPDADRIPVVYVTTSQGFPPDGNVGGPHDVTTCPDALQSTTFRITRS
jgi:hypothetical protein